MKKVATIIALFVSLGSVGCADYFAEGRVAYFHPTNERFRAVYGGGAIYGVELDAQMWKPFYAWFGTNCFYQKGHTLTQSDPTYITLIPINAGVKGIFLFHEMWKPYLGAGISATYLHESTKASCLARKASSWGCGGVFKSGLLINPVSGLLIDLYVDYLLQTISFSHKYKHGVYFRDANLSGLSFGGAVGWKF